MATPTPQSSGSPVKAQPVAAPVAPKAAPEAQKPAQATPTGAKPVVSPTATPAPTQAELDASYEVVENGVKVKRTGKELVEAYQMRQLSDKKRTEAEKLEKNWAAIEKLGKEDPFKLLKLLGHDVDNLTLQNAARIAQEKIEEQQNPEAVKARKTQEELDQYKAYVAQQKKDQEEAASKAEFTKEWQNINNEIIEALKEQQALGYDVDEDTVIEIAQKMYLQDIKGKPVSAKEAIPHVFEKDKKRIQKLTKPMNGEQLLSLFGQDTYNKVLKHALQLEKIKKQDSLKKEIDPKPDSYVVPRKGDIEKAPKQRSWSDVMKQVNKK